MKNSVLILLLSISLSVHAAGRLEKISDSMGKSSFSKLLGEDDTDLEANDNAQLETDQVLSEPKKVHKRPKQLFLDNPATARSQSESIDTQTSTKLDSLHATNGTSSNQTQNRVCEKEKVYSLDVDNPEQYKRLEDFPFTYECVMHR